MTGSGGLHSACGRTSRALGEHRIVGNDNFGHIDGWHEFVAESDGYGELDHKGCCVFSAHSCFVRRKYDTTNDNWYW